MSNVQATISNVNTPSLISGSGLPGLRSVRERRGLSKEDVASQARLSFAVVARLESGKGSYRGSTLTKLQVALRCTADDLLSPPLTAACPDCRTEDGLGKQYSSGEQLVDGSLTPCATCGGSGVVFVDPDQDVRDANGRHHRNAAHAAVYQAIHGDPALLQKARLCVEHTAYLDDAAGALLKTLPDATPEGVPYSWTSVRAAIRDLLPEAPLLLAQDDPYTKEHDEAEQRRWASRAEGGE